MNKYTIYFEIFGRKMKYVVTAASYDQAKQMVKDKIIFHKVDVEPAFNINDFFGGIFNGKK